MDPAAFADTDPAFVKETILNEGVEVLSRTREFLVPLAKDGCNKLYSLWQGKVTAEVEINDR